MIVGEQVLHSIQLIDFLLAAFYQLLSFIACFVNVVKVGMISTRLAQQILKVALITGQPLNLINREAP